MNQHDVKKVAFIQNITEQLFGYMHLSSFLKKEGHLCDVFVDNLESDLLARLKDFHPDILGFYCVTGNLDWGVKIFRQYKEINPKCLTIVGGPHPTYLPSCISTDGIDAASLGESENSMLDVCRKFDGSIESIANIDNLCTIKDGDLVRNPLRPLIPDLDSLPLPDRGMYYKYRFFQQQNSIPVMCSRGCPFSCTYCYSFMIKKMYQGLGKYLRFRSPENILSEIEDIRNRYKKIDFIHFDDSTLNADRKWLEDFLRAYRKNCNLPFFCQIRADLADEKQIDLLREAKCEVIAFGIEAGSYRLRKEILKRDMTDEQIIKIAMRIRKNGIKLCTGNIFGLPTETLDETYKLIELNQRIKPDRIASHIFQPYPGTELGKLAMEKGLIRDYDLANLNNYYYRSVLTQEHIGEQERLHKLLYYFAKFPRLTFVWKALIKKAPFSLLYFMFLVGLIVTYKANMGYLWGRMIRYGRLNFRVFSLIKARDYKKTK